MEVWIVTSSGEVIGACTSLELAKQCVSTTWDQRFSKRWTDFKIHSICEISTVPKIGEKVGIRVSTVIVKRFDLFNAIDHF